LLTFSLDSLHTTNMLKFSAALLCAQVAFGQDETSIDIAGYAPGSDVYAHSLIDLDQDILAAGNDGTNFTNMINAYTVGGNSVKGSGAIRTLQGFSTGLYAKACPDTVCIEPWFQNQYDYFQDSEYGNTIIMAALDGTGDYEALETSFRKEVATKGSAYLVAGMYASHELEDAVADCNAGTIESNDDGVHAWDEGVAFYAGSLEGKTAGGDSAGELSYRLAEKRCANYATCSGSDMVTGISNVNTAIFEQFDIGRDALAIGECDAGAAAMVAIQAQMLVPLIQGLFRYAFKADPAADSLNGIADKDASTVAKEQGEGFIFSQAVIGHINTCDPAVAATLASNLDVSVTGAYMPDGYASVVAEVQTTFPCLGIYCADIGGLVSSSDDGIVYYEGLGVCTDPTAPPATDAPTDAPIPTDSASVVAPLSALALAGFAAMM